MSFHPCSQKIEDLLLHRDFLRNLARGLTADQHSAEDALQETWLAAVEKPPTWGKSGRSWLGTVLRNFVRQDQRASARREVRIKNMASLSLEGAADDPLDRALLQRNLVQAVIDLREPYRATILYRYFEGLMPKEIAEIEKVPVRTVKSRLARGLASLRARLDEDESNEDRKTWVIGCLELARRPSADRSLGSASWWPKLLWLPALVAGIILVVLKHGFDSPQSESSRPAVAERRGGVPEDSPQAGVGHSRLPESVSESGVDSEEKKPATPSTVQLAGRVVLADLLDPVPNLALGYQAEDGDWISFPRTNEEGEFSTDHQPPEGEIVVYGGAPLCLGESSVELGRILIGDEPQLDLVLIHPWNGVLEGEVFDQAGLPISGAVVRVMSRDRVPAGWGEFWEEHSMRWHGVPGVSTDEEGKFFFSNLPPDTVLFCAAKASGYSPSMSHAVRALPDAPPRSSPRIELSRAFVVRGQVLMEPTGLPVRGALVNARRLEGGPVFGSSVFWDRKEEPRPRSRVGVRTDSDGRFLIVDVAPGEYEVQAYALGKNRFKQIPSPLVVQGGSELEVEVLMRTSPFGGLSIAGVVVDERGKPIPDLVVVASPAADGDVASFRATANAKGFFSLNGLKAGFYEIVPVRYGFAIHEEGEMALLEAGASDVILPFVPRSNQFLFRVCDARDGSPVSSAYMHCFYSASGSRLLGAPFDGKSERLLTIPHDQCEFVVEAPGYAPFRATGTSTAGGHPTVVAIDLERGMECRGQVIYPDGSPAVGVEVGLVLLLPDQDALIHRTSTVPTGTAGEFTLQSLPASGGRIAVAGPYGGVDPATVTACQPGEFVELRMSKR